MAAILVALSSASIGGDEATSSSGGETTRIVSDSRSFQLPLANLHDSKRELFVLSNELFRLEWRDGRDPVDAFDGLGPHYMAASCIACHPNNGRGNPPLSDVDPNVRFIIRLGRHDEPGKPHPSYGSHLDLRATGTEAPEARLTVRYEETVHRFADGESVVLHRPIYHYTKWSHGELGDGWITSVRIATPVFGMGLLEAMDENEIRQRADPDDRNGDGIRGVPNYVMEKSSGKEKVGRFGWKASQPTLLQQTAAALSGDMGITSSLFPAEGSGSNSRHSPEISDQTLSELAAYCQLLAVPAQRDQSDPVVKRGKAVFESIGCSQCHVERATTSSSVHDELSNQTIAPFTDMLLHDMGDELADGLQEGKANGRQWRTPPLWGIGLTKAVNGYTRYLHDGRAQSLSEAVLWHNGEARQTRNRFTALTKRDRDALMAFLLSL